MLLYSKIRFYALYLITVILGALIILEGLVRVANLAPGVSRGYSGFVTDQYLPYIPRPLSVRKGKSRYGEYRFLYKYNSVGLRDIEHALEKPAGVFRMLGLGDSFTHGSGVAFEETYLYRLECMCNKRQGDHPKVEIVKAGISGYFPEPERMFLEYYGVKYQPDLVVVSFLPNDIIDTKTGIDAKRLERGGGGYLISRGAGRFSGIASFFYFHSHLSRLLLTKYVNFKTSQIINNYGEDIYKKDGACEKEWQRVEIEYSRMLEVVRKIKAHLVIVYIPQKDFWKEKSQYPAERLSIWCKNNGVFFINTLPYLRREGTNAVLYWEKDGHCNTEGYRVIAEAVYSGLVAQNIVP